MFDVGAAGYSILAITSTAGLAIFSFLFFTYAAHCFLTIVIDSGCGIDEIRWPHEGIFDWLLKPVYCFWLLIGWTVGFGVVLLPFFLRDPAMYVLVLGSILFVIYPLTLLSSLSAKSWVALLHRPFLVRVARWPTSYLVVLALALPPVALIAAVIVTTAGVSMWFIFLAIPFVPPAILFYARLVGRYAWLVTHTPRPKKGRKAKAKAKRPDVDITGVDVAGVSVADPWAIPDRDADQSAESTDHDTTGEAEEDALDDPDDDTELDVADAAKPRDKYQLEDPGKLLPEEPEDEWSTTKKPYGVMTEAQAFRSRQPREPLPASPATKATLSMRSRRWRPPSRWPRSI